MRRSLFGSILLIVAFIGVVIFFAGKSPSTSPEIQKIKSLSDTSAQSKELIKLLDRVGPVEAQEELFHSGLPFTGKTHLLVHTVGDYVYNHYGLSGLSYCKDYFLAACYHGFIIDTFADRGVGGMVAVMENCAKAGTPVAVQCAHAAGHGFTAWQNYDLPKALEMCDELGAKVKDFGYFNCYDGVFMENMWGVHGGEPSPNRWVKADDPYYPCDDPRIPKKYINGCWADQASLAYQYYKGDLRKTAELCDSLTDETYKSTCYNNFARQVHPLTNNDPRKVVELCANATGEHWQNECIYTNVIAAWSVGDRVSPYKMCSILGGNARSTCFERLAGTINYYYKDNLDQEKYYCDKIPDKAYQSACVKN